MRALKLLRGTLALVGFVVLVTTLVAASTFGFRVSTSATLLACAVLRIRGGREPSGVLVLAVFPPALVAEVALTGYGLRRRN